jgi:hypothetical protein
MTPSRSFPACPGYGERVAIDLAHGTTLFGRMAGCVFGDCSAAHEHFVNVDKAVWEDGTVVRDGFGRHGAGKFWGIRPLTDAEVAAEAREAAFAMSLVD